MTGAELFIGGGIFLCNAVLVAYLLKPTGENRNVSKEKEKPEETDKDSSRSNVPVSDCVAPSALDIDKMFSQFSEKVLEELPRLLTAAIGEVEQHDCEFNEKATAGTSDKEEDKPTPENKMALDSAGINKAFSKDEPEEDDLPPSEPIEPCPSIDELENAVDTSMDDTATREEKVKAGKTLNEYKVTQVYDLLTANDAIGKRVDLCISMAIKAQISSDYKPKANKMAKQDAKSPVTKDAKANKVKKKVDLKGMSVKDFNPEDLIP